MLRRFSRLVVCNFSFKKLSYSQPILVNTKRITTSQLCTPIVYGFSSLPKHQVLNMPALSPTMSEGKVVKWNKKVGDALEEGDIICQVETDKATVGFQVTQKGFLAQKLETDKPIPVGSPLIVVVKKKQQIKNFQNFKFGSSDKKAPAKEQSSKQTKQEKPKKSQKEQSSKQGEQKPKKKAAEKQESTQQSKPTKKSQPKQQKKAAKTEKKSEEAAQEGQQQSKSASYPKHTQLKMPALSPTMSEGKIVKWNIRQGQQYVQGDSLCDIETDKATVAFEATQKGVLAKIVAKENTQMKVGDVLAVSVKNKTDAGKFADFKSGGGAAKKAAPKPAKEDKEAKETKESKESEESEEKPKKKESAEQQSKSEQKPTKKKSKQGLKQEGQQGRVFASPAAKTLAGEKGISLKDVGKGSGPEGRIIKQDVQSYKPGQKQAKQTKQTSQKAQKSQKPQKKQQKAEGAPSKPTTKPKAQKVQIPQNPYEQIPLTNMRKTIAARLTESKTTIPHYYINCTVQMDKVNALRTQLNLNQKQNGVKISVNDIIVKAMALALRDFPNVNAQWHGNSVRKFKHADVSVAVATQSGLITPIVYRAETLGLLDIARRTKDIAARARTGKLDPRQYIGGTTTVSNVGMFGVDSVVSVINPPQSTIVGVGKTDKRILFDAQSTNPDKPYRVAEVMQLVVSADHRVVDGAVASQWLMRIKKYLEHPTNMLL